MAERADEDAAWVEVELPFRNLILTYGGSPKVEQRKWVLVCRVVWCRGSGGGGSGGGGYPRHCHRFELASSLAPAS